jgi:hypothetical protein
VRARHPDVLIGCWGVGVLNASFRIFDSRWEGKPTGAVDLTGAKQWREKYENPSADLHPVFKRCNLNFGNPSVYAQKHLSQWTCPILRWPNLCLNPYTALLLAPFRPASERG